MIYRFDAFELDMRVLELRRDGAVVPVEPQVFQMLAYLVAERDRVVTRDDLQQAIWHGRIVSNAAVDSRVRSVRLALGDDGQSQRLLKTVRGLGFRFVGVVEEAKAVAVPAEASEPPEPPPLDLPEAAPPRPEDHAGGRPSIAVLPFMQIGTDERAQACAHALPHDLIAALSRLRWLFVIARASSFRFHAGGDEMAAAAKLGVRYCLFGAVSYFGDRLEVAAELLDVARGGVVWAERYDASADDIYDLRARIVSAVVTAMELRIPMHEAERAALKAPDNLDAWEAFHLGLRHIYRFNAQDNLRALDYFRRATALDPGFARAHAGMSFAHFQNAFVHFSREEDVDRRLARACAERAVELDPLEPFANYTLGRAHWLDADLDGAKTWLTRSLDLNPNHAQGVYTGAFIDLLSGRYANVGGDIDTARALSPYDPLRYAMLITRCMALLPTGAYHEAAIWAGQAAREPNAHMVIDIVAAIAHEAAGDRAAALHWLASARRKNPRVTQADIFRSMPFQDQSMRRTFAETLTRLGLT